MPLIVLLLQLSACVFAQKNEINHQWKITDIHGPSQVGITDSIAVDLNSDGWMDVVSASIDDGDLRAYFNPGNLAFKNVELVDLNFTQQIIEQNEVGLYRIISTDLNGDNRPDLIATSIESHSIISYIQGTNGGFEKRIVAEKILLPTDVVAGDFNKDGLTDLASISFENNEVYQHIQQSNGTFLKSTIATKVFRPRKLLAIDFNQDSEIDIAVASEEDNSIRILFSEANNFWDEKLLTEGATGTRNMASCDLDDNGLGDLVVSHSGSDELYAYYNYGIWPYQPQLIDNSAPGVNAVLCMDLNNNGQNDIAAIHAREGNIYSYFQNEGFKKTLVANTRDGYITLNAADFLQVNEIQLLTQAHFQQRNFLYKPTALNVEQVIWQDFPDGAYHLALADLNGDGLDDVVYAAFRDNKVFWGEQTPSGFEVHTIFDQIDGPQSVSTGDVDHDGDLDIVTAGAWDDTFWLHKNDGQGQFITSILFTGANNAARSKIVDLNGDGHNDVILTSTLDDSIRWVDLSKGSPLVHLISDQMDGALSFDVVDFDTDGDIDIILGNFFGHSVSLIENQNNSFVLNTLVENKQMPKSVVFTDVDVNGVFDVLFVASSEGEVWLLTFDGKSWEDNLLWSFSDSITDISTSNINQDEYLDIISLSRNSGNVEYIVQNNGQFKSQRLTQLKFQDNHIVSNSNPTEDQYFIVNSLKSEVRYQLFIETIFVSGL